MKTHTNLLKILRDEQLSRSALVVFSYINNIGGTWDKGKPELGNALGIHRVTVWEAIKQLKDRELLVEEPHPTRKNWKIYRLTGGQND